MNLKPELISFNVCPFVQRSVITLLEKDVAFKLIYIDLNNPPRWFGAISPLGKVPVLKVADTVLFESAVINEYLDEVNLPAMHPADPLLRAENRAWIEFGSDMIMNHYNMTVANDAETVTRYKNLLVNQFEQLEQKLGAGSFFNGKHLSLVDAAFAPLFMRIDLLDSHYSLQLYPADSRVHQWSRALANVDSVKNSVTSDFEAIYLRFVKSLGSDYSTHITIT
jgi:glutathione S-transferase